MFDRRNFDGNSFEDILAALSVMGASVQSVDHDRHVICAILPAHEVPTVRAMDGVSYVRHICQYMTASPSVDLPAEPSRVAATAVA